MTSVNVFDIASILNSARWIFEDEWTDFEHIRTVLYVRRFDENWHDETDVSEWKSLFSMILKLLDVSDFIRDTTDLHELRSEHLWHREFSSRLLALRFLFMYSLSSELWIVFVENYSTSQQDWLSERMWHRQKESLVFLRRYLKMSRDHTAVEIVHQVQRSWCLIYILCSAKKWTSTETLELGEDLTCSC